MSFSLGARRDEASVYVTWAIDPGDSGTIVRLYVDEPAPVIGQAEGIEAAWMPVLSVLQRALKACAADTLEQ